MSNQLLDLMTKRYHELLASEPPQDAGGHPSLEVHERVGAAWAEWDKQRGAYRLLIAAQLLRAHLEDPS